MTIRPSPPGAAAHRASLAALRVLTFSALANVVMAQGSQRPETLPPPTMTQPDRTPTPHSSGASTVALTSSMEVLDDTEKLGKGDRLSFRVVEDRRAPVPLYVTDAGDMEVPFIGRVKAIGKTCKQLAYEIKPMLEQEYFVKATVIIGLEQLGGKSRGRVMVYGQVRAPGMIELMPGDKVTISQAILRAGSLADFADKKNVRLLRKREPEPQPAFRRRAAVKEPGFFGSIFGKKPEAPDPTIQVFTIDLTEIIDKGRVEKDFELEPDDRIYVPERLFNF